jgi:hypothetical protein
MQIILIIKEAHSYTPGRLMSRARSSQLPFPQPQPNADKTQRSPRNNGEQ